MCARQEDANRTPNDNRKRPLSIIEEHDSDDSDTIEDKILKYGAALNGNGKENTPLSSDNKAVTSKNKDDTDTKLVSSRVPEPSRNTNSPTSNVSKNKSVSKAQTVSSKKRPDLTLNSSKTLSPTLKSKSNHVVPSSPPANSKIPVLKSRGGRRSALTPDQDSKNGLSHESEQSHEGSKNFESTSGNQALSPDVNHKTSNSPQSGGDNVNEVVLNSSIVSSRPGGDGHGLARIRETAERLNLTSPSSSSSMSSSSPSFPSRVTLSPKFSHRLRMQTSTPRIYHDGKSPPWGSNVPQITITPSPVPAGTPHLVSLALGTSSSDAEDVNNNNYNSCSSLDNSLGNSSLNPNLSKYLSSSPKLSSYFSRRLSVESTGSLSEGESDGSNSVLESGEETPYVSDFRKLQETTEKLRLSTRRPSTMLWRQQYMENTGFPRIRPNLNGDGPDERLTSDRKQRIDEAIEWLRNELQEMRSQDQNLARQLLTIRHDIHQLKLQRSTEEHQELIDDFQSELEELQEFSDVLDLPQPVYGNNPLKQIGVTRLNISARRFSAC